MSAGPVDFAALKEAFATAEARRAAGDRAGAIAAYRRALTLDPEDRGGAGLWLAHLGAEPAPAAPPASHVALLFDQNAEDFDEILLDRLGYDGPLQLRGLVEAAAGSGARFEAFLDLGCGTGLGAGAFGDLTARRVGVDLSAGMLAQAEETGLYDALYQGDAVGFLEGAGAERFDLIAAADLVPYLGDLGPLARGARARLNPGGLLALSAEAAEAAEAPSETEGAAWRVTRQRRFAHQGAYLAETLSGAGFELLALEQAVTRYEAGEPVAAHLALARAPA